MHGMMRLGYVWNPDFQSKVQDCAALTDRVIPRFIWGRNDANDAGDATDTGHMLYRWPMKLIWLYTCFRHIMNCYLNVHVAFQVSKKCIFFTMIPYMISCGP